LEWSTSAWASGTSAHAHHFGANGWSAFKGKLFLLLKEERPEGAGSSLVQDVGKYVAIQLGRNERLLPRAVKKKLSLYRLFD